MSNSTPIISKEDYLKKYLSKDSDSPKTKTKEEYLKKYITGEDPTSKSKKKRRKKVRSINKGYKIIDDDIDVKHSLAQDDGSDDGGLADDVPFVVSVEDEFQFKTKLDPRNWTVVGDDDSKKEDIYSNKSRHQKNSDSRKLNVQQTSATRGSAGRDQSPPRKSRVRYDSDSDQSPARTSKNRHDSDSDHSPPRTSAVKKSSTSAHSPSRSSRKRHDSDNDQSPPRTSTVKLSTNSTRSPPRTSRKRHESDSDHSLPRASTVKQSSNSAHSPPRTSKKRHDSDSDQSPPRTSKGRHQSDSDQSPLRTSKVQHDSGSNLSPPRSTNMKQDNKLRKLEHRHQSDSDQTPPRIRKNDLSTSRGSNKRHDSGSDVPVQKKSRTTRHSDSDQSPPRTSQSKDSSKRNVSSHSDHRRTDTKKRQLSPQLTRDKDNRRNNESRSRGGTRERSSPSNHKCEHRVAREYKRWHSSDSDLSPPRSSKVNDGRKQDGSPRRQNKDGPRKDHERPVKTLSGLKAGLQSAKVLRTELQEAKAKEKEHFREIGDDILGKGAQTVFRDRSTGKHRDFKKESEEEQLKKAKENEMKAKYNEWGKGLKQQDDKRKQIEEELYEMTKPLARYEGDEDLERHLKEREREGDPMLQFIRKKKTEGKIMLPKYQGPPPPPNRFNIMPGYRWDGVDRSNGFEKKLFERQSNRMALEEEAYKWSTENM